MKVNKAVITAAGRKQRTLPLQSLIDRDGNEKSVLCIIIEEALRAGVEEVGIVVQPGDETAFGAVSGDHSGRLKFIHQAESLGYGHAVYCARDFVGQDAFLHLVGDHLYVSRTDKGCAQALVEVAEQEDCSVSAVQATRESLLPYYGTIGGRRLAGRQNLYEVDTVVEKPTPTVAEQQLVVPGLRSGHYLCFFGMHVLTPAVFDILGRQVRENGESGGITLSGALAELPGKEKYLAVDKQDWRYDVGVKYGLLTAQIALAMSGNDRDEVLTTLLKFLTMRELSGSWR